MTRAPAEIRSFQRALSRSVSESERGSIATFYDLPPDMLEEARRVDAGIGWSASVDYLQFYVVESREEDVLLFHEQIVRGQVGQRDVATWRTHDLLLGVGEHRHNAVTFDVARTVQDLSRCAGERWFRLPTTIDDPTKPAIPHGPALRYRNLKYWSRIDHAGAEDWIALTDVDGCTLEEIDDTHIEIELRRWIASSAAWWARSYLANETAPTAESIVASYARPVTPSADGWIALRALAREAVSGDPRWPSQPGRIGPDDWYVR